MRIPLLIALTLVASVHASRPDGAPWPLRITALPSPAATGSAQPQLSVSSRGVILSWVEQTGATAALKFSTRTTGAWSAARTVASGTNWFVNWADVPSVVRLEDGTLAAHWLQKSGSDTYAYDVRLSYSSDEGRTWSASFTPHEDGTKTEHGFATLFQAPGAGLGAVWLDGRNMHPGAGEHGGGDMSLHFRSYTRGWKPAADAALDLRVCECCPTAVAITSDGPVAVYRDRSPDEVRDIHIVRLEKAGWTPPAPVAADGWRFNACPVNGPSITAGGRRVAVAWFQAKDGAPKALVAFSNDAGRTFGAPARLDDAGTLGRVDVDLLPDGSAAAAYIEQAASRATFRVRRVDAAGLRSAPVTIAELAGGRASGYPRMARFEDELVFAWVDRDNGSVVRTATARLPR